MMTNPSHRFNEELLSGYLDGNLTQADAQRARLAIEDSSECRELYQELLALRQTTLSTHLQAPDDDRWPELPATSTSRWSRFSGWTLLLGWLVVVSAIALWQFLANSGSVLEVFLALGLPGGLLMLFVSVLLDRFRELRTDRYRGVHR